MKEILDKAWRLNNLYRIVDRDGVSIPFKMNHVQELTLKSLHSRNLILKARQLGMSTFAVLYILDEALFNPNLTCGIVSYSIEHAGHIFKKIIGHALDAMPEKFRGCVGIIQRSAKEITFNNKSSLRVDTTLRGGAYQQILVSEFGKTCARYPMHAEEVVTGTLNAIGQKGRVIIESTAEGNEGYFADMCLDAMGKDGDLSPLDYKLLFWSWFHEPSYVLKKRPKDWPLQMTDYFEMLERKHSIMLSSEQKNWYVSQYNLLGDKVRQEFPSTVEESFLVKNEAYYFSDALEKANQDSRLLQDAVFDPVLPVYVAIDVGLVHATVLIYFQIIHGEVRVIDCYADSNKDASFYAQHLLQDKRYLYGKIFLPHDVRRRSNIDLSVSWESEFRKLFPPNIPICVLPRQDKLIQIAHARNVLGRCVFHMRQVSELVKHLMKYRKQWHEQLGKYGDEPMDDKHADWADAFAYLARAVTHIEASGRYESAMEKHLEINSKRKKLLL